MKIGILSSGGDCPGINATIRGVGKTAIMHYGMEVIGIHSGFIGLLNKDVQVFDERSLSGILNLGGTILGTSREKPFRKLLASGDSEKPEIIKKNYEELGLDCLVCIGGNGTQKTAAKLAEEGIEAKVINIHTIKPLDEELVVAAAKETGKVVTVEEHSVIGGLGSAVCDVLSEQLPTPVLKIGVNDVFGHSGPAVELIKEFGLDGDSIAAKVKEFVK